ncbi:uncharacterized protein LOC120331329 [Styela clava]
MDFVKILLFISLIRGSLAGTKLPAGACVSKIVDGKLIQVGDCKKDDGSEIARLIQKSLDEKKQAQRKCDATYNSKCFRTVVYATANVTFNNAEPICKSINGKLANIYDLAHLQLLFPHLRLLIPAGQEWIQIWTGMEFKNEQLLLSNGEAITLTEAWLPNFPKKYDSAASYTNVALYVYPGMDSEGIFNDPPTIPQYGVICEI